MSKAKRFQFDANIRLTRSEGESAYDVEEKALIDEVVKLFITYRVYVYARNGEMVRYEMVVQPLREGESSDVNGNSDH